ncbi:PTS glucose transporter subunit IIA, partial [Staphylococcus sp. EG-SA-23]|uniref:PTS glucose transporter subunit IIA n=1 Tax=Staphylococcus sp. EG-SA-23 TaxID=2767497 RepID=UPI001F11CCE1
QSEDGVDIVIHIGVNTVDLEGKGFECFVKQNDRVEAGQTLLQYPLHLYLSLILKQNPHLMIDQQQQFHHNLVQQDNHNHLTH